MNKQKTQHELDQEGQSQPGQDPIEQATALKANEEGTDLNALGARFDKASQDREQVLNNQPLLAKGDWSERQQKADANVAGIKDDILQLADRSSPEEIRKLQDGIAGQSQSADEEMRQSQGLPKQTSEQSMEQKIEQSNEEFQGATQLNPDRLKEWRQGRGQGGNQSQADDRQSDDRQTEKQGQGGPTNYAEYAAGSKEEAEDMKQLEQRQHKFVHDNGRWPRGGEIEKIEAAEREQEQTRKRTQ